MPKTLSIDQCYQRLKLRADKSGYNTYIAPDSMFNLLWQSAEQRHFNRLYEKYPEDRKSSTSLSVFSKPVAATIGSNGQYTLPNDFIYADSIYIGTNEITRVEKDRLANNLNSSYDAPDATFPIYTEYSTYLQFYPVNLGSATLNYLSMTNSFWGYTLAGSILTFGTLVGGTGYANGTYPNVPLQGGIGVNATAIIVVSGGVVTSVTIANSGIGYLIGDNLGTPNTNLGSTGSGFVIKVGTIAVNARPVYSVANSVQPLWSIADIDMIIDEILRDMSIISGDPEVGQYANQGLGVDK